MLWPVPPPQTIASIIKNVQQDNFNLLVHVGDIACTSWALPSTPCMYVVWPHDNSALGRSPPDTSGTQSVWDTFFTEMQPAVANLPYMTIPGNVRVVHSSDTQPSSVCGFD